MNQKYIRFKFLQKIAQETEQFVQQGFYFNPQKEKIFLDSNLSHKNSVLLSAQDFQNFDCSHLKNFNTKISVTNESTTQAIYRLIEGEKRSKVVALNLASYRNPGGAWLQGAEAQEEHLAKCSNLVNCLSNCLEFYTQHSETNHLNMALDLGIFSPNVSFFRHPDYSLRDKPVCCDILTVAAPDLRNYYLDDNLNLSLLETIPKFLGKTYKETLESRLRFILQCMTNNSTLVLGAAGCGVFRNDPRFVASTFHHLLKAEFAGVFEQVVFAILDVGEQGKLNLKTFQDEFVS